jgi:hypothetical protein
MKESCVSINHIHMSQLLNIVGPAPIQSIEMFLELVRKIDYIPFSMAIPFVRPIQSNGSN